MGAVAERLVPSAGLNTASMAVVGMAALVGSGSGAMLTAIVMLFEMTGDYNVILPVVITMAIADAVRRRLCPPTIYTLKLLRRGHIVPPGQISRS